MAGPELETCAMLQLTNIFISRFAVPFQKALRWQGLDMVLVSSLQLEKPLLPAVQASFRRRCGGRAWTWTWTRWSASPPT